MSYRSNACNLLCSYARPGPVWRHIYNMKTMYIYEVYYVSLNYIAIQAKKWSLCDVRPVSELNPSILSRSDVNTCGMHTCLICARVSLVVWTYICVIFEQKYFSWKFWFFENFEKIYPWSWMCNFVSSTNHYVLDGFIWFRGLLTNTSTCSGCSSLFAIFKFSDFFMKIFWSLILILWPGEPSGSDILQI